MSFKSSKICADQLFLKELCPLDILSLWKIALPVLSCVQFLPKFYETCIIRIYDQCL